MDKDEWDRIKPKRIADWREQAYAIDNLAFAVLEGATRIARAMNPSEEARRRERENR